MSSRQRWVIVLPVLLGSLDLTVVTAVLPAIVEELAVPLPGGFRVAAWLVAGYLTTYAAAVVLGGVVADQRGTRAAFVWATSVFAAGSLLVAVGTGTPTKWVLTVAFRLFEARPDPSMTALGVLIAARCIQALGAGAVVPAAMAAVSGDASRRMRDLGFVAGVEMGGWMLGHLYGGLILQVVDWRMIFWINLPFAAVAIWFTRRTLPTQRPGTDSHWFGVVGGALGLAAIALGMMAPWSSMVRWAVGLSGALVFALLFDRLVPRDLIRTQRPAAVANVVLGLLIFFVLAAVPLFVGTLIEAETNRAALLTGLLLSVFTVPMAAAAPLGGRAAGRSERGVVLVSGAMAMVGLALCRTWTDAPSSLVPGLLLAGIGLGGFFALTADRLVRSAAAEPGRASGTVIVLRLTGMSLGTALLTDWVLGRVDRLSGDLDSVRLGAMAIFDEAFVLAVVGALILTVVSLRRGRSDW